MRFAVVWENVVDCEAVKDACSAAREVARERRAGESVAAAVGLEEEAEGVAGLGCVSW